MNRICIEGLIAFIILIWSFLNYGVFDDPRDRLGWKGWYPLVIGAICQAIISIIMALRVWAS